MKNSERQRPLAVFVLWGRQLLLVAADRDGGLLLNLAKSLGPLGEPGLPLFLRDPHRGIADMGAQYVEADKLQDPALDGAQYPVDIAVKAVGQIGLGGATGGQAQQGPLPRNLPLS